MTDIWRFSPETVTGRPIYLSRCLPPLVGHNASALPSKLNDNALQLRNCSVSDFIDSEYGLLFVRVRSVPAGRLYCAFISVDERNHITSLVWETESRDGAFRLPVGSQRPWDLTYSAWPVHSHLFPVRNCSRSLTSISIQDGKLPSITISRIIGYL